MYLLVQCVNVHRLRVPYDKHDILQSDQTLASSIGLEAVLLCSGRTKIFVVGPVLSN